MTTLIEDMTDFNNWISAADGTIGKLTADITYTNTDTQVFPDGGTLDGDGNTIIVNINNSIGIFNLNTSEHTATIKNIIFDCDAIGSIDSNDSILFSQITQNSVNVTVTDCGFIGTFSTESNSGTVIPKLSFSTSGHAITVRRCYSTATISGYGSGGIVGHYFRTSSSTFIIDSCYTTGEISGTNSGGIVGESFGSNSGTTNVIKNCYSTGEISGNGAGGIAGQDANSGAWSGAKIANCYSLGDITGTTAGGIMGADVKRNNGEIENCYSKFAVANVTSGGTPGLLGSQDNGTFATFSNNGFGSGTWGTPIGTYLDDNYDGGSDIWKTDGSFSDGYGLTVFNESPWDVDTSYTSNTSQAQFAGAGGAGDPHITTISGDTYYLDTWKPFRFFHNSLKGKNELVINANIKGIGYEIWKNMQYINQIYIKNGSNSCVISTGFRGELCEVVDCEGDIKIKIDNLDMKKDCKQFCADCRYRTRDPDMVKMHTLRNKHQMIPMVRNRITCTIEIEENVYNVVVENVNSDNFRPSSVVVKMKNMANIENCSGAIVREDCWDIPNLYSC